MHTRSKIYNLVYSHYDHFHNLYFKKQNEIHHNLCKRIHECMSLRTFFI
jgi:hypothetical protein